MRHITHALAFCAALSWSCFMNVAAQQLNPPIDPFTEASMPVNVPTSAWNGTKSGLQTSWGTTDVRYEQHLPPKVTNGTTLTLTAWQGERVNAQFLLWAGSDMTNVKFEVSNLKAKKGPFISAATNINTGYVRYVITDELNKDGSGGCGHRPDKSKYDSSLVADIIDPIKVIDIKKHSTRPGWITIQVPQTLKAGVYTGSVTITANGAKAQKLSISLTVKKQQLAEPKDWGFHLDLWQNPYAVARVHNVPLWSKEHFDAMRPYMTELARAGQKVITASIMHKPWNGQTEDAFETMVTWLKKADGSWYYDFTIFDKWVEFMMSCGIRNEINCYSMIPWRLSFQYYDQATNSFKEAELKPGKDDYNQFWGGMLKAFAEHLKEKEWFNITTIAMDERPMEQMREVILLVKDAAPEMKISLAGNYHGEIEKDIHDYCIAYSQKFPEEVLKRRRAEGKISTYYTCCTEAYPNTFTFSAPAEAEFLGWYALAGDYDGYLRWAYNSWTANPLQDSRFRTWAAGDTYMVYPGYRSSIRWERLIEGIQQYEKYTQLMDEAEMMNDNFKIKRLEAILKMINKDKLPGEAADMVRRAKAELNKL